MKKLQGLLILIGIAILGVAASAYIESKQYSNWDTALANLQEISLQNASSPTVAGASDWGSDIGRASYSYEVGGIEYKGNRIMPLQNVYLPREKVISLSKGAIKVTYNPSEPSQSFIFAIMPITQLIMLCFGGIISMAIALSLPRLVNLFLGAAREST
jgi:hypothetical protein